MSLVRLAAAQIQRLDALDRAVTDVVIRPMDPDPKTREHSFVWETTMRKRHPGGGVSLREWAETHGLTVQRFMDAGNVLVADAGGGVLLGFVVTDAIDNVVRMVYVKKRWRGEGLGLRLLAAANLALPLGAYNPTPCWMRWASHHGIPYERVRYGEYAGRAA